MIINKYPIIQLPDYLKSFDFEQLYVETRGKLIINYIDNNNIDKRSKKHKEYINSEDLKVQAIEKIKTILKKKLKSKIKLANLNKLRQQYINLHKAINTIIFSIGLLKKLA